MPVSIFSKVPKISVLLKSGVLCSSLLLTCLLFVYTSPRPASVGSRIVAPLKVSATNPNYFVNSSGKAVVLTGSHTWNNLQDWGADGSIQPLDFNAYVNMLRAHNQNFTLLWRTELPHFCNLPTGAVTDYDVREQPWLRTGPGVATDGKPKFDLTRFDQGYFDRLRARTMQLQEANIYAGVYLFTGEWVGTFRCSGGNDGYPFSGANNINGVTDGGGGAASVTMNAPNAITQFQDAYVRKTIDTLNDLPNVLWIVSEESPRESDWWNHHLIAVVRSYEATKLLQHPIGYGVKVNNDDSALYDSNADWVAPAIRISPLSTCGSGTPACKVNINDSDHSYFRQMWHDSAQENRNYFWENFVRGNSVVFMDPYTVYYPREGRNMCASPVNGVCAEVDQRWENVRATMGYIRSYGDRMNLIAMTPRANLSSTGFALANTGAVGSELLVYSPNGGKFAVNLSYTSRAFSVEWLNPATGVKTAAGTVRGGSPAQEFGPPFMGDAVLYLVDAGP
jgi:hypothetical protein